MQLDMKEPHDFDANIKMLSYIDQLHIGPHDFFFISDIQNFLFNKQTLAYKEQLALCDTQQIPNKLHAGSP